ncbi:endonuclease/exonuclease/phosphatase family protein [Luteolibacter luteus]|uniref:Endonuclease/exonuclease/phosphatase family protein n=1 Tax=Luteolibacter luteus TaxID=2728835 RepID=A0A858RNH5_9BACT|nr:endonuclease/exonuclease/phosphatase family protein [Luteolibacter luteus]QJE98976.1 endonuclease/exonuclease/phosphatase family protein [Luteolibacter luteus]
MRPSEAAPRKRLLRLLPRLLLAAAALGTVGSGLGMESSHIERMSHFRLWWLGLLVVLLAFFIWRRRWCGAVASVAIGIGAVLPIAPYWKPLPSAPASSSRAAECRVIAWNVLHDNPGDRQAAAKWLAAQDADLILLTECTLTWQKDLAGLASIYPHQLSSQRDGSEGMLLLSKHPLEPADPEGLRQSKPWISTVAQLPSGRIRVLGMHPRTPRSGPRFDERNLQYQQAARITRDSPLPVILMGDLNCTPFSPWFRWLLKEGNLHDSAVGHGFTSTWSGQGIGLPIDHVLAGPGWQVMERKVHPDSMGSDHHPVLARLQFLGKP